MKSASERTILTRLLHSTEGQRVIQESGSGDKVNPYQIAQQVVEISYCWKDKLLTNSKIRVNKTDQFSSHPSHQNNCWHRTFLQTSDMLHLYDIYLMDIFKLYVNLHFRYQFQVEKKLLLMHS